jgi:hypothetical protein
MDAMRAMSPMLAHLPSRWTLPSRSIHGEELSPSLDNPLLALESVALGVDPDVGVVLEKLQVAWGEVRVWGCFVESGSQSPEGAEYTLGVESPSLTGWYSTCTPEAAPSAAGEVVGTDA